MASRSRGAAGTLEEQEGRQVKGHVLDFSVQANSGIISGDDNQRYTFTGADWMETDPPRKGMAVDFATAGDQATQIYAAVGAASTASYTKSKLAAGLLAIFLGGLGIHKFYLGYKTPGIILLLCGTIGWLLLAIPPIIASIIGLIEGIIYLTKQDDKFDEEYVVQKKPWF